MSTLPSFRRTRQTKIVATLGPASSTAETIRALFLAGVDTFRLNFSHGSQADHAARLAVIREIEKEYDHPIAVMADLQGPKLRLGTFEDGWTAVEEGQSFRLTLAERQGGPDGATLPHPEVFAALTEGQVLLLDDGKVRLRVTASGEDWADTIVEAGVKLSDRKGVNVPNAVLPLSPLTAKDRSDLAFALDLGVDWVALSFVQRPEDIAEARKLIAGRAHLVAKLEKPSAIEHLREIVELSDAVMVARGDLGVEMPAEEVPPLQKRIVRMARMLGRPVIVATQMMESMIGSPTPTRAEASDVATAVYDGADAVMLSAETASGAYPVEAVTMMDRIAQRIERDPLYRTIIDAARFEPEYTSADAITAAARQVAHTVRASGIATYTTSGSTTLRAARERPEVPILCLTSSLQTARRMALCWGVHAVHTQDVTGFSEMVDKACRLALHDGFGRPGDALVITAGVPFGTPGNTNVLRIARIEA